MFKRVLLIAHRGYSSEAPENTFAAFDLALQRGYKDIELDVQLSRDGVPVIIHDESLERTTNGTGMVAETDYKELSELNAGSWFAPGFGGQRIPTLESFLKKYHNRANLHLEIKSPEPELPQKIVDLLQTTGWLIPPKQTTLKMLGRPKLVISSFIPAQLARSKAILPKSIIHELLVETVSDESLQWAAEHGMRSYHSDGNDITLELTRKAHKLGLEVGAWWWTAEQQNIQPLRRAKAKYAYVDAPHIHRQKLIRINS